MYPFNLRITQYVQEHALHIHRPMRVTTVRMSTSVRVAVLGAVRVTVLFVIMPIVSVALLGVARVLGVLVPILSRRDSLNGG